MDRKTKTAIALAKHQAYGGVLHIDGPQPQSVTPISPAPAVSPALQKATSQADLLALQKSLPPATYAAIVGQPAGMELDDTRLSAD